MSIHLFEPDDVDRFLDLDEGTQLLILRALGVLGHSSPAAWEQLRRSPDGEQLAVWAARLAARQG